MKPRREIPDVPDDLTTEQWNLLSRWASEKESWSVGELEGLVEQCLDHHRARDNPGRIVHWLAACRMWIRNERAWRRRGHGAPGQASRGGQDDRGFAAAARAAARNLGLFEQN